MLTLKANDRFVVYDSRYGEGERFAVENEDGTFELVSEAVIVEGKPQIGFSKQMVDKAMSSKYPWAKYIYEDERDGMLIYCPKLTTGTYSYYERENPGYCRAHVFDENSYEWRNKRNYRACTDNEEFIIDRQKLSLDEFRVFGKFVKELSQFRSLGDAPSQLVLGGKGRFTMQIVLGIIGKGKIVTPISLSRGCAKGECVPRLKAGDSVQGKKASGVICGFKKDGIVFQTSTGSKITSDPSLLEKVKMDISKSSGVNPCLQELFDKALEQKKFLFRAAVKVMDRIVIPVFKQEGQEQQELVGVATCCCPVCGWQMAKIDARRYSTSSDHFECCFCRQTGVIISLSDTEVILRLNRLPSKNQFAIMEAACCSNCREFGFETGRQGKRSTGYCKNSNQCVQAFNTCGYWIPREPTDYDSNIKQHTTNLGYGVKDRRNTSRNDITDTIYCEEDHVAQKLRGEEAKQAYTLAYSKFLEELREIGGLLPLVEEKADEAMTEEYKKVLQGGVE
jgi:hypothetical protein